MALNLTSVSFDVQARMYTSTNAVKASFADGGVTFTAATAGAVGNNISIVFEETASTVAASIPYANTLLVQYDSDATNTEIVNAVTGVGELVDAALTVGGTGGDVFSPTEDAVNMLEGGADQNDIEDYVIDLAKANKASIGADFADTMFKDLPSGDLDNGAGSGFLSKVNLKEWVTASDEYEDKDDNASLEVEVGNNGTDPCAMVYYETDTHKIYEVTFSRTWTSSLPIAPSDVGETNTVGVYKYDIYYVDAASVERCIFTSTACETSTFAEIIGSGIANENGIVLDPSADNLTFETTFKLIAVK